MEDIRMVNTKAAYAQLKPELDEAFKAVMESMQFSEGPQLDSFARKLEEYVQVHHAIPCANGTAALRIALKALELPPGAEIVLPAFSYTSGAEVVEQYGLKPVFADVLPATFTLDPVAVGKVLTPATAVIMPVNLFGQCAEMHSLLKLAQKHQLWVLEDNTQALGAVYSETGKQALKAGSMGHISITSFLPTKPDGDTGEGGALFTNDAVLAEKMQQLLKSDAVGSESMAGAGLDTLQAAMLEVKIKLIDALNQKREEVALYYDRAFAETQLVKVPARTRYSSHVYQQYTIIVAPEIRDGLQLYLRDNYIPSMVYYPQPLHLLERYNYLNYKPGDFPVAEELSKSVLSLPMHSELKLDQLEYICQHVLTYTKRHG